MSLPLHTFNTKLFTAQDLSLNSTSLAQNLDETRGYCIQLVYSGSSPTGTFQVQGSNDGITYTNVPGTQFTVAITANGSVLISDPTPDYSWVQIIYTFVSGTGTVTAIINGKR